MTERQDIHEVPTELADALARIDQAKENHYSLGISEQTFYPGAVAGQEGHSESRSRAGDLTAIGPKEPR